MRDSLRSLGVVFFGCLLILLLLQLTFRADWFQDELQSRVRVLVQEYLGMTPFWDDLEFQPLTLTLTLRDLRIYSGKADKGTPFLQSERVAASVSLLDLFQRKVIIERIDVREPTIVFANYDGEWINFLDIDKIDELASRESAPGLQSRWSFVMRTLRLENADIDFVLDAIDLRTRLTGVTLEGSFERLVRDRRIPIELHDARGLYRMFGRDFQLAAVQGELAVEIVEGSHVDLVLDQVRIRGSYPVSLVEASGRVVDIAGEHILQLQGQGETELNFLNDIFFDQPALTGTAAFQAAYHGDFEVFELTGQLQSGILLADDLVFSGVDVETTVTQNRLDIHRARANAMGGRIDLDGRLAFGGLNWRANLTWFDVDLARISTMMAGGPDLSGFVSGQFTGRGNLVTPTDFGGILQVSTRHAQLDWPGEIPRHLLIPGGDLRATLNASSQGISVASASIETPRESVQLVGSLGWDGRVGLEMAVQSGDFSPLDAITGFPIGGWGTADGTLSGSLAAPEFAFDIDVRDVTLPWVSLDEASGRLEVDLNALRLSGVQAAAQGGRATMADGFIGPFDGDTRVYLPVDAEGVSLGRTLAPLLEDVLPLDGSFTGRFELDGPIMELNGFADGIVSNFMIYDETVSHVVGRMNIEDGVLVFPHLQGHDGLANLMARGYIDPAGGMDFKVWGTGIPVGMLAHTKGRGLKGVASGDFHLTADDAGGPVRMSANAFVDGSAVGEVALGRVSASLRGVGDALHITAVGPHFRARMGVSLEPDYPARITASATGLDLSPVVAQFMDGDVGLTLDAETTLQTKLTDWQNATRGEATLSKLALRHQNIQTSNTGPVSLSIGDGWVSLAKASFHGPGTRMDLGGRVGLDGRLRLTMDGGMNLQLFRAFIPYLASADGVLKVEGGIRGTVEDPLVEASLSTRNSRIEIDGVNLVFEGFAATAAFRRNQILIDNMEARIGDGRIQGGGYLLMDGFVPTSLSLYATLREAEARIPEWLLVRVNGSLEMVGPIDDVVLRGNLDIVRALYDEPISWEAMLLRFGDRVPQVVAPTNDGLRLDLGLHSAGSIFVQNNLVDVKMRGDLHLSGYVPDVDVFGNLQFLGGSIVFRENVFEFESGQVNFLEGGGINPYLDIRAQTRIEEAVTHRFHEIDLIASGPADDVRISLESTPPLPREDILSLLYIRRRASEGLGGGGTPAAEALSLAFKLNEELAGFQSELRQYFGFEELVLEPAFTEASGRGTMRLRATKSISQDMTATISTSLTSNDLAFRLGYGITDNVFMDVGWNSVPEQQIQTRTGRFGNFRLRPRLHFEFD